MIYSHQHGEQVFLADSAQEEAHLTVGIGTEIDVEKGAEHKPHILVVRGDDHLVLVLEPETWTRQIYEMMDVAEKLGGPYRDALIAAMRYRRSRFN